jgi:hypothetical protein
MMLSNMVGTLLAFVTIMLMLSLIVTSLVQFTQAALRLRARNLLVGVAALLKKHSALTKLPEAQTSPLRSDPHLALAARVLNQADASPKYIAEPNATGRVLMGPPTSWVPPDDLARAIVSTLGTATTPAETPAVAGAAPAGTAGGAYSNVPATAGTQAKVKEAFENMEPSIAKRFQFIIRIWTVAWSFVIAFAFQLSTPDLLKTLPSEDAKREAILAAVPNLTNEATRKFAFSSDDVLEQSISALTGKFPQYTQLFAEVAGLSGSKQEMMGEMRNVLRNRPDKELVLNEYSSIIDAASKDAATTAYDHSAQLISQLDTFGISPKLNNFKFYAERKTIPAVGAANGLECCSAEIRGTSLVEIHWARIIGVLMTGILLSLGAPFWFEQLKNLSNLRDTMNPSAPTVRTK